MLSLYKTKTRKQKLQQKIIVGLFLLVFAVGSFGPIGAETAQALDFIELLRWTPLGVAYDGITGVGGTNPLINALQGGVSFVAGKAADAFIFPAFNFVAGLIQTLASWFLLFAGSLFDLSLAYTLDSQNIALPAVLDGWRIIRDFANMVFIFILLYIAFMTILQLSSFNTKKILVRLILVGIFINFSAFFTGFVIDTANILGGFFYNAVEASIEASPLTVANSLGAADFRPTVSEHLIQGLRVGTVFDSDLQNLGLDAKTSGIARILGSFVMLIAGFVLLSGAIMFVLRTVYLVFLIILSPIAFIAAILPATAGRFNQWLKTLLSQAFVVPMYLLLLLVVVRLIESDEIRGTFGAASGDPLSFASAIALSAQTSTTVGLNPFAIFLPFAIISGLLVGIMIISKQMTGGMATAASGYAGKLIGVGIGGAALTGRQTFGRGFSRLAQSTALQDKASEKGVAGGISRLALRGANYGSKATFDARSGSVNKAVGGALSSTLSAGGQGIRTNLGKAGGKGGYDQWKKDEAAKEQTRSKMYDNTTEVRLAREKKHNIEDQMVAEANTLKTNTAKYKSVEDSDDMRQTRVAQTKLLEIKNLEKEVDELEKGSEEFERAAEALYNDGETAKAEGRNVDALEIEKKLEVLNKNEGVRVQSLAEKEKQLADLKPEEKSYQDLISTNQGLITAQNDLAKVIEASDKKLGERNEKGERVGGLTGEKKTAIDNMLTGKRHAREDYAQVVLDSNFVTSLGRTKKENRDIWDDIRFDAGKSQKDRTAENIRKLLEDSEDGGSTPPPTPPPPSPTTT